MSAPCECVKGFRTSIVVRTRSHVRGAIHTTLARGNFSRKLLGAAKAGGILWVSNQGYKSLARPWVGILYSESQSHVNKYLWVAARHLSACCEPLPLGLRPVKPLLWESGGEGWRRLGPGAGQPLTFSDTRGTAFS